MRENILGKVPFPVGRRRLGGVPIHGVVQDSRERVTRLARYYQGTTGRRQCTLQYKLYIYLGPVIINFPGSSTLPEVWLVTHNKLHLTALQCYTTHPTDICCNTVYLTALHCITMLKFIRISEE